MSSLVMAWEYFPYWKDVRKQLYAALEATPEELLNWAPKEGMYGLGDLYRHIADTINWWLAEVGKDGGEYRELSAEDCPGKDRIKAELERSFDRLKRFADKPSELLYHVFKYELEGKTHEFTARWILWHLYEHEVHHRAQIFTYLRMNGIAPPKM